MAIDIALWKKRIDAARQRRLQHETWWAEYALLHARANNVITRQDANDDKSILLPNGDQVKLSLIHRNIEQTLGVLEVPEIGVRATIMADSRELSLDDTNREDVVAQALVNSSKRSGLLKGTEEVDYIKRDALVIGHGICFTWFRQETREREIQEAVYHSPDASGQLIPVVDEESGEPVIETRIEKTVIYQAVQDEHVPVLEFLFDARALRMDKARWHGREQVVPLDALRADERYAVPEDLEPSTFVVKDIYGENLDHTLTPDQDYVRKITVWDVAEKQLLTFIEAPKFKKEERKSKKLENQLLLIAHEDWPVLFQHPDDSPFSFFIPIPANDHPFGISQVEHVRIQANEADKLRTRQANRTRAQKRIMVVRKGMIDTEEFDEALKKPDMALLHMDLPEDFNQNRDIFELPMPRMDAELLQQQAAAESDVDKTSGISATPYGGASTATESENMMAVGGARPNRKRRLYFKFLESVLGKHRDYLRAFAPEGEKVTIIGGDGMPVTTQYGKVAFAGDIDIEVQASGELSISPVRQKMLLDMAGQLMGRFGPAFDLLFIGDVFSELNFRGRNRLLTAAGRALNQPAPVAVPGTAPSSGSTNLNDYTNAQAIRAAVNNPNEG